MLNTNDRFGDYTVVRLLGRGGMGSVYLLSNAEGAEVAAKILDPASAGDHESRRRFLREAELALGVKHPNLVEVYDVGEDPDTGLCYILMEYVSGGSLADFLKENGALPIEDAVAVVEAMAGVLELARQKGIVHRDIKPANIMFDAEGTPKLADLGIARGGLAGTEMTTVTQTGMMIGTPAYMAPEQMLDAHNVDTRADIYSLGVVFYEMLTGERPNKDDTVVQLMAKAVKGEPLPDVRTLRPEVSASLAQLLSMMVVPDKDGRIATPGQITNALAIIERGGTFEAKSPSVHENRRTFPWRKAVLPVVGLVVFVAVFAALQPRSEPSGAPVVREVFQTNVVERAGVENHVTTNGLVGVKAELAKAGSNGVCARQTADRLKKVSELEPRVRKQLEEMASKRKSGASRGVMVFGKLRIGGVCTGRHVASYAWLNDDGFFTADVWPRGESSKGRRVGGQLNFLRHGYRPLDLDLVREADRKWSDEHALDLGCIEMEKLGQEQARTMSFAVNLPQGVDEAELVLSLRNEKPCGYDWSVQSRLQHTSVDVLRRRVPAGGTVEVGDCTLADYALVLKARGCASYKRQLDMTDATVRNLKSIVLPRAKVAKFAIRPFVGGTWETASVLVDNEQALRFHDGQSRHRLLLDPFEEARGIVVSSYYNPSSFDDYGELTPSLFDAQIAKGAVAQPFSLDSGKGRVRFFPGRIYRFRNSYLPIDALIAFLDYCECPSNDVRSATARTAGFSEAKELAEREFDRLVGAVKSAGPLVEKAKEVAETVGGKIRAANRTVDPEKLKDSNSTRRVQKTLDALFPGWKTTRNAAKPVRPDEEIGYVAEICGRRNVLATLPPSRQSPVRLTRTTAVPENARLSFAVRKNPTANGGLIVQVYANGKRLWEGAVTDGEWLEHAVDLSGFAGKKVKLEIRHVVHPDFGNARALWSRLEIN